MQPDKHHVTILPTWELLLVAVMKLEPVSVNVVWFAPAVTYVTPATGVPAAVTAEDNTGPFTLNCKLAELTPVLLSVTLIVAVWPAVINVAGNVAVMDVVVVIEAVIKRSVVVFPTFQFTTGEIEFGKVPVRVSVWSLAPAVAEFGETLVSVSGEEMVNENEPADTVEVFDTPIWAVPELVNR